MTSLNPTPMPAGVDVQINTTTASNQQQPSVTALADGGFVTIWLSLDEVNSEWGIHARRYDSNGVEVGDQFRVNTSALVNQGLASVKALADGGFVVAWTSNGGLPSAAQVLGQRFGSDGIAVGSEFRINSNTTVDHSDVAVAGLSDGGFVAAWAASGQDGSLNGIYGQRFKTDGAAIGGEFRINTYTTGDQVHPALATMADGSFVVTWSSAGQDGDGFGIYGQRFASNGASVGTEFRVNTLTVGQQTYSSPAALLDGGFVVTWTSFDGNGAGIFGQRYGANGAATGAEFRINTYTNDSQTYASVTALSDGGFVVTWSSKGQDGSGYGIFGQRFTVDALPAGSEFRVNDITDGDQIAETYNGSETLATLGNGRLVQVWSGLGSEEVFFTLIDVPAPVFTSGMTGSIAENAPTSVVAYDADATSDGPITYSLSGVDSELFAIDPDNGQVRFLASPNFEAPADKGANNVYDIVVHARDGLIETTRPVAITVTDQSAVAGMTPVPLAGDVQVNSYTPGVQAEAAVTSLSDGGFVVTWTSFDGNGAGISGQRYAENGTAVGSEFKVNTSTTNEQTHPSVTSLSDGGFVVTWSSRFQDGSGYGVYGQRYAEDGIAVGGEFKINTSTAGDQFYSPATPLPDGGFVVTWMSLNQDGTSNIYGQRYAQNGSPAGSEFKVNTYTGGSPREPAATSLSDGGFLVTWTSFGQDGSAGGVYGQRYGADGTAHGGEFKVNSYTTNTQSNSSATSLPDGGFVVTWSSLDQDHSGYGIYGQRYAANGSQVGGEFKANTETGSDQRYSSVTSLHDGGFVVSWTSLLQDGSGSGVYGQRYAADGTSMGGEFRLNQITAGDQGNVTLYGTERVTSLNDGHFVQVWSGTGTTEVFFRRVEVPWGDDNAAPTITSDGGQGTASLSVAENTKGVTTVVADDTDYGQTLTYSLAGGTDAAAFAIDGKSGELSFVAAPDFEAPADANKDNVYEVVVKASDGAGGSDSQAIGVTVTDVNTAPTITSGATGTVAENAPVATVVYDAAGKDDGENSGTLTYSLAAGGDSKLFDIDAGTGEVRFKASPDFEAPGDADGNNVYQITVQASDGSLAASQAVAITVTDQNDVAPVINTSTIGSQEVASVTALSDGGFLVAWTSSGGLLSGTQVYGQRFGSDGVAVGSEFRINSSIAGDHYDVAVSGLSGGGFLAAWAVEGRDGSSDVYGQRYQADGAAVGGEFRINTYTTRDQYQPALATMANGGFVVTWSSSVQDGDGPGVYGQRFALDGTPVGTEFRANNSGVGEQGYSAPAPLLDGGFVITWTGSGQVDDNEEIFGQRYAVNGDRAGTEFQINTYTKDSQICPSVTGLSDGGFVVTWSSRGQDGSRYGVYGQRFTADAVPAGSEFRVNGITDGDQVAESYNGSQTLATLSNGRLVQVWSGRGTEEVFFTLIDVPAPVFTSGTTGSIPENTPTSVVAYDADASSDGPITYSLSGTDSNLFAIDPVNGQVGFLASPNFEAPADKGANNVYDIVVHARDGLIETTRAVAITVTNVSAAAGMTPVPLGGDVQANSYTPGVQAEAAVTSLSDGGFVATWTSSDGNLAGISGRRYAEDGTAVGSEYKVNTYTTSEQTHSSVTSSITAPSCSRSR